MSSTRAPGSGCRGGHEDARNPTLHPRWGQVPSASAAVIGGLGITAIIVVCAIVFPPGVALVLAGLVALGLLASAAIQALLGHRGACWAQRTVRWWLGPIGTLADPLDIG